MIHKICSSAVVRCLLTLLCGLLFVSAMFAQSAGSGSVSGTLTDPSGAVITGATISVKNVETGSSQSVVTNASGAYFVPFLQPGKYEVAASRDGFGKALRTGLNIEVGQKTTVNIVLKVSAASETVNVTGEIVGVDTSKVEVSQSLDKNSIESLPLIGRRWENFVLNTPAATTDGGLVSYRGVSGMYNLNMVDGANNNNAFWSEARGRTSQSAPYTYGLDTIAELQVNTSNYSAEFGQAAGGIINAVTKSGTNAVHGDVFYYLRYPALNAMDSYSKSQGIKTQTVHQQQQFGGSVGGPIIKDKLFYFLGYDGYRKSYPLTFASYNATKTTFGLTCPAALSAQQCSGIQSYIQGNLGAVARVGQQDLAFGKLDYQVNARNRVSTNVNWDNYGTPNGYSGGSVFNNSSISTNGKVVDHTRSIMGNWSSIISNSLVNSFRAAWSRDLEVAYANSPGPSVSITSVFGYGMPNALPRPAFPDEHRIQLSDTLSQTYKNHQFKYGVDVNFIHELLINLYQGGGVYSYTASGAAAAQTSFNNWSVDVYGINIGDGLTGRHWNTFAQVTDPITHVGKDDFYNDDFAGFVEDNWKVTPVFTLNLGIRYDVQSVPQPNKPNTFDALTTNTTTKINIPKSQFAPRVGFSYAANDTTVFRGGFGMFYAKTSNSTFYAIRVENGIYQQTFNCSSPAACGVNAQNATALTFPNVMFTPPGLAPAAPFAGALTPTVQNYTPNSATQLVHGLDPKFVNPIVYESNIAMENRLPGNVILTIEGLNSRGQHLPVFVDANLAASTSTRTFYVVSSASAGSPATQISSLTVPAYTSRIDPTTGVVLLGKSAVKSWYNAFVMSARKPFSHGLEGQLNYTFGKSLDQGSVAGQYGTFYGTDAPTDPANLSGEKGPSDNDQRQRFSAMVVYRPEFAKNIKSPALRYAADGFTFAINSTLATGQPYSATVSGTIHPSGSPDYGVTGGSVSNSGGNVTLRMPATIRNQFNLPSMQQVDLRVSRDFPIHENLKFQILAEAFNLLNRTNVFGVNTTAYYFDAVDSNLGATHTNYCPSTFSAGSGGCFSPNTTATGTSAFKATTQTSSTNGLYTARQMQFSAKIIF